MKFITFIASTMLIVLFSQHSIMGLPLNDTLVCSEGMQWINGQCLPIDSLKTSTEHESSSHATEELIIHEQVPAPKLIPPRNFGGCPKGMEHGEHGICQEIQPSTTTEQLIIHEQIPLIKLIPTENSGGCPKGMEHGKYGICHEIQPSTTAEVNVRSTTEFNDLPTTTELNAPPTRKFNIKSSTEFNDLSTTTELDENVGGVDIIKGCPKGTQPDEQGACVAIQSSNSTTVITDPKFLLINGSCPVDYKMLDGRCLYIKPKKNLTLEQSDSTINNNFQTGPRPKTGTDEQSEYELVSVLADNSCPEGTEYSEFGLCRKRIRPTISHNINNKESYGNCDNGSQFINGKCVYTTQSPHSRPANRMISTSTPSEEASILSHSTSTVGEETAYEQHLEVTSTPL